MHKTSLEHLHVPESKDIIYDPWGVSKGSRGQDEKAKVEIREEETY